MVAIVTRAGKGSPLTNTEVDDNFLNLNSGKVENTQAGILAALGYTPVNKTGDTMTGALNLQGDHSSGNSLLIYNTTTTDGRAVAEFRNDRNAVQRYLIGVDPDGGSNKAFALRDVTGGGVRLWMTTLGNLNVGPSIANNSAVNINKLATGSATLNGFGTEQSVQSDVSTFRGYNTALATQAATFTLGSLIHYRASQGTFGAGSTVTSQNGFVADASMIGAGTNIGFRGAIPSGSNRWNLFMDGTASNFLGGNLIVNAPLGFGAAGSPGYGTSGQFLKSAGSAAAPSWGSLTSGEVTTALGYTPYQAATATSTTNGLIELGSDTVQSVAANAVTATASRTYALQLNASGQAVVNVPWTDTNSGGTVTSVGLSLPGIFSVSGSPVTTSGTLTASLASQTANTVFAAPNGAAGAPTFRALVSADLPTYTGTLTSSQVTTALGYTPYNSTNPSGYITGITSGMVTTALGYTPYNSTNPSGYITSSGTSASAYRATIDTAPVAVMNSDGTFYGHVARRTTQQWGMGWGNGVGTATTFGIYYDTSGNFTATGNVTAYSDERLKRNWRDLPEDFVEQLALVKHGIYDRTDSAITQVGVSAQSLRNPLPNAVDEDVLTGTLSVNYGNAALVASVALAKQVVELKKQLKAVQEKLGV